MRLSLRSCLIGFAALLLLALGSALLLRRDLVSAVAEWQLRAAGFDSAAVAVAEFGPNRLEISRLAFGPLEANDLILRFRPTDLLRGEVAAVEIGELDYRVSLATEAFDGGSTDGTAIPKGRDLPPLPRIEVKSGRLVVEALQGRAELEFTGEALPATEERLAAALRFTGRSTLGAFRSRFQGQASATLDGLVPKELDLSGSASLPAESPSWTQLGLPAPQSGALGLDLELVAEGGDLERLPQSPAAWLRLVSAAGLKGRIGLSARALDWPDLADPVSLALKVSFEPTEAGLRLRLPATLDLDGLPDLTPLAGDHVVVSDLAEALSGATAVAFSGLNGEAPSLALNPASDGGLQIAHAGRFAILAGADETVGLAGRSEIALGPDLGIPSVTIEDLDLRVSQVIVAGENVEEARLVGRLAGSPGTFNAAGTLTAQVREAKLDDFRFQQASLQAPVLLIVEGDQIDAEITGPGRLAWRDGVSGGQLVLPEAHSIAVSSLAFHRIDDRLSYDAALDLGRLSLGVPRAENDTLDLNTQFGSLTIEGGWSEAKGHELSARIPLHEVSVPALELIARDIEVEETYRPAEGLTALTLRIPNLSHDATPPLFAPLSLEAELEHGSPRLTFAATARTTKARPLATLEGRHDLDRGVGAAQVRLAPNLLAEGSLPLIEILPGMADLTLHAGYLAASAELSWQDEALQSHGRLELSALDLGGAGLDLQGLDTTVAFESLYPLRSAARQTLSADLLTYGEKLNDVSAVFALNTRDDGAIVIDIDSASASSSLGPLKLAESRAIPQRDDYRMILDIADLDLARLSQTAAIEGLSGEGHLSGRIPVTIQGDRLEILGAHLANREDGVLQFRSDTARQALSAGGEPVTLMLEALEDFHYQELKLEADSDAGQELQVLVTTLGQNPKVLEGHPFRFNIRLTSNLPKLIEVLRQGEGLRRGVLGKLWKLEP